MMERTWMLVMALAVPPVAVAAPDVVGIEVKPSRSVRPEDADGLRFLKELAGDRFRRWAHHRLL